jgi:hypothetical protein
LALIGLGVLLTLFFGVRTWRMLPHLQDMHPAPPAQDASAIETWMTVPHVARITHVPESYLWQQLGLSARGNRRASLETLQTDRARTEPDRPTILAELRRAVAAYQAENGTMVAPSPRPPGGGGSP